MAKNTEGWISQKETQGTYISTKTPIHTHEMKTKIFQM